MIDMKRTFFPCCWQYWQCAKCKVLHTNYKALKILLHCQKGSAIMLLKDRNIQHKVVHVMHMAFSREYTTECAPVLLNTKASTMSF